MMSKLRLSRQRNASAHIPSSVLAQVKYEEGLAMHKKGLLNEAQDLYRQTLTIQPDHFEALHLLGVIAAQRGNFRNAIELISRSIVVNPLNPVAHANLGDAFAGSGQYQAAVRSYDQAIELKPDDVRSYENRNIALKKLFEFQATSNTSKHSAGLNSMALAKEHFDKGNISLASKQYQAAVDRFDEAIAIWPNAVAAYINRGLALNELKHHQAAIDSYDLAISILPRNMEAHFNRGLALHALKRYEVAIESYEVAISLRPEASDPYYNLGSLLHELEQYENAIKNYEMAIARDSRRPEAHFQLAIAFSKTLNYQSAIDSYKRAIAIKPDYPEAYFNLATIFSALKVPQEALDSIEFAISIRPDWAVAHRSHGNVLFELGQYKGAIESYDRAIAYDFDQKFLHGRRLHTTMMICAWRDVSIQIQQLASNIRHEKKVTPPFAVLALCDSLELQLKAAQIWVDERYPATFELGCIHKKDKNQKIRVGYFSADFYNHATAHLMAELFERHDRGRIELFAFSFGPDTDDEMHRRLLVAFDSFLDVRDKSDKEVARLCRSLDIDISVDLKGFTKDNRAGIFSYRVSPIQVNYLGYPGTMGSTYIDYLIADRTVIPEASRQYYTENIIYLPNTYQVNDSQRKISDKVFTRGELGLPASGFVFCCFNNSYKITPNTFDGWMRILNQVEGSVLWLLEDNPIASSNLRHEAHVRGVSPERLVFAQRMPPPDHLARHRAADLFIDTLPYNAHTTASDALWTGLPVLTRAGEAFASRVAASLLSAIDMPELITSTQEEYEALAVSLALNNERLQVLKKKLERNRFTTPLFDAKLFTHHIEEAYTQMMERYHAGLEPQHIVIGS